MAAKKTVHGVIIEPPRPTGRAYLLAILYLGAPLIGLLALFDIVLYLIFRFALERCYGVFCLLG